VLTNENEIPALTSSRELPKKEFKAKLHSFLIGILKLHNDYGDIPQITAAGTKYKC